MSKPGSNPQFSAQRARQHTQISTDRLLLYWRGSSASGHSTTLILPFGSLSSVGA